jgi:hypothetical protein
MKSHSTKEDSLLQERLIQLEDGRFTDPSALERGWESGHQCWWAMELG